jgi:hypothetical protein
MKYRNERKEMKNETLLNGSTREEKKVYTAPRIEAVSSVREATKGSTLGQNDANGTSGPLPSDPQ